jgi:hypothetical protein
MMDVRVLDGFYDNPQEVIEMALCDQPSPCPGMRSTRLVDINSTFFADFKKRIFSMHNIPDDGRYVMTSYFNQITAFEEDVLNYNWPHLDGDVRYGDTTLTHENYKDKMILGGMIILCDIVDDLNTNFWSPVVSMSDKELFDLLLYDYIITRGKYERGEITLDEFKTQFDMFHWNFKVELAVPNKFNRMISWKSGSIRGQKMVTKKQGVKLTHNFYIHTPIQKR